MTVLERNTGKSFEAFKAHIDHLLSLERDFDRQLHLALDTPDTVSRVAEHFGDSDNVTIEEEFESGVSLRLRATKPR